MTATDNRPANQMAILLAALHGGQLSMHRDVATMHHALLLRRRRHASLLRPR